MSKFLSILAHVSSSKFMNPSSLRSLSALSSATSPISVASMSTIIYLSDCSVSSLACLSACIISAHLAAYLSTSACTR